MVKNKVYYIFLVMLTVFGWSSTFAVTRDVILSGYNPYTISLMRAVLTISILTILIKLQHKKLVLRQLKDHFIWLLGMSITGVSGCYLLQSIGLHYVDAGKSSLINSINPGLIVLFGALIFKERLNKRRIWGTVVSFIGILIVVFANNQGLLSRLQFNPADLIFVATGLFATFYTVFNRLLGGSIDYVVAIFWMYLLSIPFLIPSGLSHLQEVLSYGPVQWSELLYLAAFCGVIANLIWYDAVMKIGVGSCGLINSFSPFFGVIIAWLFLGEKLTPVLMIGALILTFGVLLGLDVLPISGLAAKRKEKKIVEKKAA